jgi:M6 family metalloprotease-like protein
MRRGLGGAGLLLCIGFLAARAAPLWFVPQHLIQPDGTTLNCYASGDEYYNWLHDANGYTIMQDPLSGYYVYALKAGDELLPSSLLPGRANPEACGLLPWLSVSADRKQMLRRQMERASGETMAAAPPTGTINNIVVFIRFFDESEFTYPLSRYESLFNNPASGANSMHNYFLEASYAQLTINSTFYPTATTTVVSYQDTAVRAFFQPYNATTNPIGYQGGDNGSERTKREHELLARAVAAIAGQVPSGLVVDSDNDGRVDNTCFIVSGRPTGWASLLWPHRWSLYSLTAAINGKRVYDYNLQLDSAMNVGVLCHEMFHSIGSPDLYHYTSNGIAPVGGWDVMESNANPPQHMGAYMKYKYGKWINSIPTISSAGRYSLLPLTSSTGNVYRVNSPYSTKEFFILEYRKRTSTFENMIPGEGLVVYRINSAVTGNANGPPDEVYVYRPGGTPATNGSVSLAAFSQETGRDTLNDTTNPRCFLASGMVGGLGLTEIGTRGSSISFTLGSSAFFTSLSSITALKVSSTSVLLGWTTGFEKGLYAFGILRSATLADTASAVLLPNDIQPQGVSAVPNTYSFTDGGNSGEQYYRIKASDSAGVFLNSQWVKISVVGVADDGRPLSTYLAQNYPNPFNPKTTIAFVTERTGRATLEVFDLLGRKVGTLFDGISEAGRLQQVQFTGTGLASGAYQCVLTAGDVKTTRRLLLLR